MPPTPPPRNRNNPRGRAPEKKKIPAGKIVAIIVFLLILVLAGLVWTKVPPTVELEKQMDAAAESLNMESVVTLGDAIAKNTKAVNSADAVKLGNEIIALLITDAATASDYRSLAKIEEQLTGNPDWKLFNTDDNQKRLTSGWKQLLDQMRQEIEMLENFKLLAVRLSDAKVPAETDIRQLAGIQLPVGFSAETPLLKNAAYAAAVVSRNQALSTQLLEAAADQNALRAGTEESCKDCSGSGSIPCQSCARNPGKCPACNGNGKMTVASSVGRTFESSEINCKRCEGTGNCTNCKGTGNRECFQCKGAGTRVNSDLARQTMKDSLETLTAKIDVRSAEYERLKTQYLKQ